MDWHITFRKENVIDPVSHYFHTELIFMIRINNIIVNILYRLEERKDGLDTHGISIYFLILKVSCLGKYINR